MYRKLCGRAPRGACGLKSMSSGAWLRGARSRPARGAWIEITASSSRWAGRSLSRPVRGAWIEIEPHQFPGHRRRRRAPRGARGLKYNAPYHRENCGRSRPARGAWIEIKSRSSMSVMLVGRAPRGARGLKLYPPHPRFLFCAVAPREGRVGEEAID